MNPFAPRNPFTKALEGWDGDHWIKGALRERTPDGHMGYCALGRLDSIASETHSYSWAADAVGVLENLSLEMFPERVGKFNYTSVPGVNNHPDTTWDDMVSWFEKAALRWEEKEMVNA